VIPSVRTSSGAHCDELLPIIRNNARPLAARRNSQFPNCRPYGASKARNSSSQPQKYRITIYNGTQYRDLPIFRTA
jgi:hypothetical protein